MRLVIECLIILMIIIICIQMQSETHVILIKQETTVNDDTESPELRSVKIKRDTGRNSKCNVEGEIKESYDLKSFDVCESNNGQLLYKEYFCERGHFFNDSLRKCFPLPGNGDVTCVKKHEKCPNGFTGTVKHPDESLPRKYVICLPKMVMLAKCPLKWYFNVTEKICMEESKSINTESEVTESSTVTYGTEKTKIVADGENEESEFSTVSGEILLEKAVGARTKSKIDQFKENLKKGECASKILAVVNADTFIAETKAMVEGLNKKIERIHRSEDSATEQESSEDTQNDNIESSTTTEHNTNLPFTNEEPFFLEQSTVSVAPENEKTSLFKEVEDSTQTLTTTKETSYTDGVISEDVETGATVLAEENSTSATSESEFSSDEVSNEYVQNKQEPTTSPSIPDLQESSLADEETLPMNTSTVSSPTSPTEKFEENAQTSPFIEQSTSTEAIEVERETTAVEGVSFTQTSSDGDFLIDETPVMAEQNEKEIKLINEETSTISSPTSAEESSPFTKETTYIDTTTSMDLHNPSFTDEEIFPMGTSTVSLPPSAIEELEDNPQASAVFEETADTNTSEIENNSTFVNMGEERGSTNAPFASESSPEESTFTNKETFSTETSTGFELRADELTSPENNRETSTFATEFNTGSVDTQSDVIDTLPEPIAEKEKLLLKESNTNGITSRGALILSEETETPSLGDQKKCSHKGPSCSKEGYFRFKQSCTDFYRCHFSSECNKFLSSAIYACPKCLKFNAKGMRCDLPENVPECYYLSTNRRKNNYCTGTGRFFIPDDCHRYYDCRENGKGTIDLTVRKCPSSTTFSRRNKKCSEEGACDVDDHECTMYNFFLGDNYDCNKYYRCLNAARKIRYSRPIVNL